MSDAPTYLLLLLLLVVVLYASNRAYRIRTGSQCGWLEAWFSPDKCWQGSDAQYSLQSKTQVRKGLIEMTGSP